MMSGRSRSSNYFLSDFNTTVQLVSSFSQMSGTFRARRPVSPPPASQPVLPSQRFPHSREGHLDADERRAVASKGFAPGRTKSYPPGGLNLSSGEWKLLFFIILIAS